MRFSLIQLLTGLSLAFLCASLGASSRADDPLDDCGVDSNPRSLCVERAMTVSRAARTPRAGEEGILEGKLLWVGHGDSLRVLVHGQAMEVRLADVDAPERDQSFGWDAKLQLIDLVRGKQVLFAPRDVDRHGRVVARAWTDEFDVCRELVRRGAAWFYTAFAEDKSLRAEEQRARAAEIGLWESDGPHTAPWIWREIARKALPARGTPQSAD